jgi:amidase
MNKEIGGQFSQLEEATIVQLQAAMARGQLTARRLVEMYLERIQFLDQRGPRLNSVLEINADCPL